MEKISKPSEEQLESIYTETSNDISKCQGSNHWTEWQNARNPQQNDGDDYETLHDHKILFGYVNSRSGF